MKIIKNIQNANQNCFLKRFNTNHIFTKFNQYTEYNSYNTEGNIKNILNSHKKSLNSLIDEFQERKNTKATYINLFDSISNRNKKNNIKNILLSTPISNKIKKFSSVNHISTNSNSKSKIESKIINLKKEIGIPPNKKEYLISCSEKKNSLFKNKSLFNDMELNNGKINTFYSNIFIRNKNNCIPVRNYNKNKSNNVLRSEILKSRIPGSENNKNLEQQFKELNNCVNKNILSKNQIKKKYYQSRNNLNINIIKSKFNFNIKNKTIKNKNIKNKTIINSNEIKRKNNYSYENRKADIFENININSFIKSNKNKSNNNNLISKTLNQLNKELQCQFQESIDIENIDNSSILDNKENKVNFKEENNPNGKISKIKFLQIPIIIKLNHN